MFTMMSRRSTRLRLGAAVAGLGLVAVLCAQPVQAAAPNAAADLAKLTQAPKALPSWPKIGGRIPNDPNVYFMSGGDDTSALIKNGLTGATKLLGWQLKTLTYSNTQATGLNSAMVSAINYGAHAIVMIASTSAAVSEALTLARSRGVIVIQIGGSETNQDAFTGLVDNVLASAGRWGEILGAAVAADAAASKQTAKVAVVSTFSASAKAINEGFRRSLKSYCRACSVVNVNTPFADLFTGRAGNSVVSAIQRDPSINYVDFPLGLTAAGVRPALNNVGFNKVKIVGLLPSRPQLEELKAGGSSAWVVVPNRLDGWLAVDAILRKLTGGNPKIHNQEVEPAWVLLPKSKFDASTLPELDVDYRAHFANVWNAR